MAVEKLSAWTGLVRSGEVLLSLFSSFFLGGESLWCCRWTEEAHQSLDVLCSLTCSAELSARKLKAVVR